MLFMCMFGDDVSTFEGIWEAKRVFAPVLAGRLLVFQEKQGFRSEIGGSVTTSAHDRLQLTFGDGVFRGSVRADGNIEGHWIQPRGMVLGSSLATPVLLKPTSKGVWSGRVDPIPDELTLFLAVKKLPDGTLRAYLRNPERNIGSFLRAESLVVESGRLQLLGQVRGAPEGVQSRSIATGSYDASNETITMYFPSGGMSFDFRKASDRSGFPARHGRDGNHRKTPPKLGDGWDVGAAASVGLSEAALDKFRNALAELPDDSVSSLNIHAVLLACKGKLVFEEYFHGFSRESLHDLRSASKSLTSIMVGAAAQESRTLNLRSKVTKLFPSSIPGGTDDPRRASITVQDLLTMSSGLDCDDSNSASVGNEDVMQGNRKLKDYIDFTLKLPMMRNPGEKAVYGSAQANLLGGVVAKERGQWLPDFFRDKIARPLGIDQYAFPIAPDGEGYAGGGMYLKSRDFLKFGQMMLQGGVWKGHRIISKAYVQESTVPRFELAGIHYGYLWWIIRYQVEGRTVEAFFAGGNGGQLLVVIPEKSIVMCCFAGNYSDPVMYVPQREWVPKYILPAVSGRS